MQGKSSRERTFKKENRDHHFQNPRYHMYKFSLFFLVFLFSCAKKNNGATPPPATQSDTVKQWLTTGDMGILLQKQSTVLNFDTKTNPYQNIDVDSNSRFQQVDGFGFTLTGGSASLINQLAAVPRASLLNELFGKDGSSISISYLRLSIGASDLNPAVFSYDDMPAGQTDTTLAHFSLGPDTTDLVPLLKQILAINPAIKIIAAPWSAPVWMKDNNATVGGSLLPKYYAAYALYFVKYIQEMKAAGIHH